MLNDNRKRLVILIAWLIACAALGCYMLAVSIGMHANSSSTAKIVAAAGIGVGLIGFAARDAWEIHLACARTRREAKAAKAEAQNFSALTKTMTQEEVLQLYWDPDRGDTYAVTGEPLEIGDPVYFSTPSRDGGDAMAYAFSVFGVNRPPRFDENGFGVIGIDHAAPGGDKTAYAVHDPFLPGRATRRHEAMMSARSMLTGAAAVRADRRAIRQGWQAKQVDELTPAGRAMLEDIIGSSTVDQGKPEQIRQQVQGLRQSMQFLRIGQEPSQLGQEGGALQLHTETATKLACEYGSQLAEALDENDRLRVRVIGQVSMATDAQRGLSNLSELREEVEELVDAIGMALALADRAGDLQATIRELRGIQLTAERVQVLLQPAALEGGEPAT